MAIEISRESLNFTQDKCSRQIQYISDCDIIVPDSKPDVLKVLEVQATEQINEKSISRDYITLSGVINHNILYVSDDEEKSLQSIEYTAPFTQQISANGADDTMMCHIKSSVVHTEHSIHNSRKLNVKCAVDITANAYNTDGVSVVTSIGGEESMPCKTKSVNSFNVAGITEHVFHIEEQCSVPEPYDVNELLRASVHVADSELKIVVNKVVIKGNLMVKSLFISDGEICSADNEIPFTQIIDVDAIDPDMYTVADFCVKNVSVQRELDTDATMSNLSVNADIGVCITSYDERHMEYVSDVYSPDYNISVHNVNVQVEEMVDSLSGQCIVNDSAKLEDGDVIEKVYSLSTKAYTDSVSIADDGVTVSGNVNVVALCKTDGADGISSVQKQIPFSCSLPVSRSFDASCARCDASVETEHSSYSIDGADSINVRLVLRVASRLLSQYQVGAITDIDYDEQSKIDKSSQAGITVYFVQNGDEMWDIAKRYHTTADEIVSVNKLDANCTLSVGQQLLIPKRN
ncbi:MAG: DUF3794 domain-containing protein [Clostridia bacterium]|nr:DUF3794 domain-containing protein [Clostridia bacterium]